MTRGELIAELANYGSLRVDDGRGAPATVTLHLFPISQDCSRTITARGNLDFCLREILHYAQTGHLARLNPQPPGSGHVATLVSG